MNKNDSTIEAERNSGVAPASLASLGLSIVRDDPAFRLQRKLGLIPETGLGIARRALFWSWLAWLPIVVWAAWTGRAIGETAGEPLLGQFRLEHAHRLRRNAHTDLTVTEVALRCGFLHLGRFAAFYRQVYGVKPSVAIG